MVLDDDHNRFKMENKQPEVAKMVLVGLKENGDYIAFYYDQDAATQVRTATTSPFYIAFYYDQKRDFPVCQSKFLREKKQKRNKERNF